jgi:hypothetical protein
MISQSRAAARTALWDLDVRDATFANVVSDARRAMARAVPPPDAEEWIERTLTEQLPLHPHVVSDADLLRARTEHARTLAPAHVEVLRPGLELVTDIPFAGTGYLWPDAEGITSALTLLATGAATDLARAYLALGDVQGVFWATGQGLKVLSGHEELIALRMRATCPPRRSRRSPQRVGGLRACAQRDPWSTGEPSRSSSRSDAELLSTGLERDGSGASGRGDAGDLGDPLLVHVERRDALLGEALEEVVEGRRWSVPNASVSAGGPARGWTSQPFWRSPCCRRGCLRCRGG